MGQLRFFLKTEYLENSAQTYLIFVAAIILGLIFKGLISRYLSHSLYRVIGKKEKRVGVKKFDSLLTRPIAFFIMLSILYFGFHAAEFNFEELKSTLGEGLYNGLEMIVSKVFSLVFIYSIFRILLRIVDYVGLILLKRSEETENKMDDQLVPFAMEIIKFIVYIFTIFIILGNVLGVNVTALVTGLGIGGLALAMASKESLENLLGSFTIFLDKPFTVGDTVTAGTITGTVEKVGFRSTQIRTFDKSLVTVPNKKMIDAELDNLGMRPVRRVKFDIGLNYETTAEQMKNIVSDIQNMVDDHPKTNDEGKVRFQEFGSSSLDVLVIYFVDSPTWNDLIDVREDINYKIMEIVKKHNSDFAFPSTTVYLQKN
jgi:MscS family membrane protein